MAGPVELKSDSRISFTFENALIEKFFQDKRVKAKLDKVMNSLNVKAYYQTMIIESGMKWKYDFKTNEFRLLFGKIVDKRNLEYAYIANVRNNLLSNAIRKWLDSGEDINKIILDMIDESFMKNVIFAFYNALEQIYQEYISKEKISLAKSMAKKYGPSSFKKKDPLPS